MGIVLIFLDVSKVGSISNGGCVIRVGWSQLLLPAIAQMAWVRSARRLSENRTPTAEIPFWPFFPLIFVKDNPYSPQMTEKNDSKWASLATVPILGQPPRFKRYICCSFFQFLASRMSLLLSFSFGCQSYVCLKWVSSSSRERVKRLIWGPKEGIFSLIEKTPSGNINSRCGRLSPRRIRLIIW